MYKRQSHFSTLRALPDQNWLLNTSLIAMPQLNTYSNDAWVSFRVKVGSRTAVWTSRPVNLGDLLSLTAITAQNTALVTGLEIVSGTGNVQPSANCYTMTFTGQTVLYIGIHGGRLCLATDHSGYFTNTSVFEVYILGS